PAPVVHRWPRPGEDRAGSRRGSPDRQLGERGGTEFAFSFRRVIHCEIMRTITDHAIDGPAYGYHYGDERSSSRGWLPMLSCPGVLTKAGRPLTGAGWRPRLRQQPVRPQPPVGAVLRDRPRGLPRCRRRTAPTPGGAGLVPNSQPPIGKDER